MNNEPSILAYFVDRDTERKRMSDAFLKVVHDRKPAFMLVHGDFGMGKSALVEAFLDDMDKKVSGLLVGRGRCANENQQNGLLPFAQALNGLASAYRKNHTDLGNVMDYIGKVAPGWVDVFTAGAGTAIQKTILESRKYFGQNYDFSPQNVQVQYANALERITEKRPAILFVDDFHWADPSSIGLLNHLAQHFNSGAVLFVITFRSIEGMELRETAPFFREVLANQQMRRRFTEIELKKGIPLADYAAKRYPGNDFSPEMIQKIEDYTEGHPLWVAQLFTFWEETDTIKAERLPGGQVRWSLPEADTLDLENLQQAGSLDRSIWKVLDERLRLLDPVMQDLLAYAAVEGEFFSVQVLARLSGLSEEQVFKYIARLERDFHLIAAHEMVELAGQFLDTYRFSPRNARHVIYQRMPPGERRILHHRVGECLETLGQEPAKIAGQLSKHFKNAHNYFKAAGYALYAARVEQSHSSFDEGETWCGEGLILLERLPDTAENLALKADLLETSGNGYLDGGSFTRAEARYCAVLDLAGALQLSADRIAQICVNLAHTCRYEGNIDRALAYLDHGKQTLLDNHVMFGESYLALDVNSIFLQRDNSELALYSFTKLLEYAQTLPTTTDLELIKARTYNWLGVIQGDHLNRFEDAARSYEKAIAIGKQVGDDYIQIICMLNLADDYAKLHNIEKSEDYANQAWEIAVRIGDQDDQAYVMGTRGIIHNMRGAYAEAVRSLQQAIQLSELLDSRWNMGYMYTDLATAYLGLQDLEQAAKAAQTAVESSTEGNIQRGYALFALGQVESAKGDFDKAHGIYQECIDLFSQANSVLNLARVRARLAADLLQCGQKPAAAGQLQAAIPVLEHYQLTSEHKAALELLARCEG